MSKCIIGKPYITKKDNMSRLCADIKGIIECTLYYEVEGNMEIYLCTERSDSFLLGALPYMMSHSKEDDILEIYCEAPISEKLYYQLKTHYIPTMVAVNSWCSNIAIIGELEHENLCKGKAVGAGVSGGVDSWYTLLSSLKNDSDNYKVSHGVYCETELFDYDIELRETMSNTARNICEICGIEYVFIRSNLCKELYSTVHEMIVSCMYMSYALALQKMFSVYYFSSSHTYWAFGFEEYSSEYHQLLNVHCFSTESLEFYVTGSNMIRHEKTSYIADFEMPRKYLVVCREPSVKDGMLMNCSRCSKCTRTMIDLDIHNKLTAFADIFDIDNYRNKPSYYWGYLFFKGKKNDAFIKETLDYVKEHKIRVPVMARIAGVVKWIKNGFKRGNPLQRNYRP